MKKHDEGYALPFVLVVMLVMCAIAVSVMSFSLRNLQVQQASIQKMQAKYEYKATETIKEIIAAIQEKEEMDPPIKFNWNDDSLKFAIKDNVLKLAASAATDENDSAAWVIAAVEVTGENVTAADFYKDGNLTISAQAKTDYLWYEVVDEAIATKFIDGAYNPYGS